MFNLIKSYIKSNVIMALVVIYLVFSAVLNALTNIDFCIPCIWKTVFGFNCPGCGLTTASIYLLKLDIKKAFESNWLIFIIIPFGLYYLAQDYKKHKQKYYVK